MYPLEKSAAVTQGMPEPAAESTEDQPTRTNPARRRCRNCGKFFWAIRKDHWFDTSRCRKQFHENGTAYGKLRQKIFADIDKKIRAMQRDLLAELGSRGYLTRSELRDALSDLVERELTAEGIACVRAAGRRKRARDYAAKGYSQNHR